VNETGSGSHPKAGFDITSVDLSGSAFAALVRRFVDECE
jgi:hypothetical protein